MGAFIDGVQRRDLGTALVRPVPGHRRREETKPRQAVSMDGLVRRVVATPTPSSPRAAPQIAQLSPAAKPLRADSAWYLPTALAMATIGLGAGSIATTVAHIPSLNVAALLPRSATVTPATRITQPNQPHPATTPATLLTMQQAMQGVVNQQAAAAGVPTGIVTVDLQTGAVASSNPDATFTSASLYKLFVAYAIYQAIDGGKLHYTDLAPGTNQNIQSCLNAMITVSSNPCGVALGSLVGWDAQNANLQATGFTHTLLRQSDSQQTSAGDVALLLHKLYHGNLVSASSSNAFISLLKAQRINDRLPVGLPSGVTVAHKTGDLNGLVHDAGIVYAPSGNYIVVAMSGPWSAPGRANSWFASLSDSLYTHITAARTGNRP